MSDYKFVWSKPISGRSTKANFTGQIPRVPRVIKTFENIFTHERHTTTDWAINMRKKQRLFDKFFKAYCSQFIKKEITILTGVVNLNIYPNIGNFVSDFKKKLRRKNISIYGHIWCRDFEEKQFQEHIHIYIAISRISEATMKSLFIKKKHDKYNFSFPKKTLKAAVEYLKKKKLIAPRKKRTYGASKVFDSPTNIKTKTSNRVDTLMEFAKEMGLSASEIKRHLNKIGINKELNTKKNTCICEK